jgi:uncharacterized protein (TIGR02147 family)
MPEVTDFLEYREYLRAVYDERKAVHPYFSMRYMAGKIGIDPGYLVKVLQGKRHLADDSVPRAADLCKLKDADGAYFTELVRFAKARSEREIREGFDRLMLLRGIGTRVLEVDQAAFWSSWRHHALRSLLGIGSFGDDPATLGRHLTPPATPEEVRESLDLLDRLGLAIRDKEGRWLLSNRFVSSGASQRQPDLRPYILDTLRLAGESFDRHPKEARSLSSVTIAVGRDKIPALQERIREFRQEILRLAQAEESADVVMQLNLQLFPLAFLEETP